MKKCQSWEQSTNQINSFSVLLILFWCAIKVINVWNMLESVWTVSLRQWEGHGCFFSSTCSSLNVSNQSVISVMVIKNGRKPAVWTYLMSAPWSSALSGFRPALHSHRMFFFVWFCPFLEWLAAASPVPCGWKVAPIFFFFFKHCLDWSCTASLFVSIRPFLIYTSSIVLVKLFFQALQILIFYFFLLH